MNSENDRQIETLNRILASEDAGKLLAAHSDFVVRLIPEVGYMIGFEHNHPHHHLDVWEHTLAVINNLHTTDRELNMAGLLHDIGKPFSYQDDEVRHFHGHPKVSYRMSNEILTRLGYDPEFIRRVGYLVAKHDTAIDIDNLDNSERMLRKLLKLQYADARAHHPDKVQKRIEILDSISRNLKRKFDENER